MRNTRRWTWLAVACLAIASLATAAWWRGHASPAGQEDEDEERAPATQQPSRVSVENGETVLKLDTQDQSRLGLQIAVLQPAAIRQEFDAPAMVLPVQDLVAIRQNYLAAETALRKAQIGAEVARKEYERVNTLYHENQNASEKALDTAQATLRSAETDVQSSQQQLGIQIDTVRQSWGGVVANWLRAGSPEFQRMLDQRDLPVELTLPPTHAAAPPRNASLEIAGMMLPAARLVSSFPRVDPRVQGLSFLYVMPARSGIAPGTSLVAHLATRRKLRGVVVPATAVIWREGQAWVYVQTSADHFTRRAIATDTPDGTGFLATTGVRAGDKVVVKGAEMLLSEEFASAYQPED